VRAAGYLVVAFVLLLTALAAFVPATFADRRLAALTGGELRLGEATGTIWRGQAVLSDRAGTWHVPLGWHVLPGAIARGALALELHPVAGAALPQGTIEARDDALSLAGVTADFPARALATALAGRDVPAVGGTLTIEAPAFAWSAQRGSGTIAGRWVGARVVARQGSLNLGTVDLTLVPEGPGVTGIVKNAGGDVRIDGRVALSRTASTADITASPEPSAPPHVAQALAALGTPERSGAVRIAWRGGGR
jgi:hypothetical protein